MIRPFETLSDATIHAMLDVSIFKLNMTPEHDIIMQDIGYLIVEQLVRMEKTDELQP